jgi:DNA-binding NtrC family response regulator
MNNSISDQNEVWVIDDDQSIRWVLDRSLANAGFKVTTFETASKALAQFKRAEIDERPGLILTDFRMPGINGFELLKQLKRIDKSLPVIIMTAYSDLDTTVQAYQEGAFEYLAKPFDIDDAIELVSKAHRQRTIDSSDGQNIRDDGSGTVNNVPSDWKEALQQWANKALASGESAILATAIKDFEKTLMECALNATHGRKQEAAKLLGWGRNTLTRKLKAYR